MFLFRWEVWQRGYEWIHTPCGRWLEHPQNPEPHWLLTTGKPARAPGQVWQYFPLQRYTGLFREFAETPPTQDGIVTFANRYGMLTGGEIDAYYYLPNPENPGTRFEYRGEHNTLWTQEIKAMWEAVNLWDLIQGENWDELRRYITWEGQERVYYEAPKPKPSESQESYKGYFTGSRIADKDHHAGRLEWLEPGDVIIPAQCHIQDIINKHQAGRVSPQMVWNTEQKKLSQYFVPQNLLGALWLQFALAIDGSKRYACCPQCQIWFAIATKGARVDKRFCTDTCRQRAFRSRKDVESTSKKKS